MARQDDLEVTKAAFALQLALIAHGNLVEGGFDKVQKQAAELLQDIAANAWPWVGRPEDARKQVAEQLADIYRKQVGDPRDPKFMAKLVADAKAMEAKCAAPRVESEEERIARKLLEKYKRRP